MSGNAKFRFLLAPIVVALLVVVTSPVSWAGELEDAKKVSVSKVVALDSGHNPEHGGTTS